MKSRVHEVKKVECFGAEKIKKVEEKEIAFFKKIGGEFMHFFSFRLR